MPSLTSVGVNTSRGRAGSRRGLLLVEALLSAVVIGVGLVFISRGLSGQVKALRTVEEYETLLILAHGMLAELEGELADDPGREPPRDRDGIFEDPHDTFAWTIEAGLADDSAGVSVRDVSVTVRRNDRPSSSVRVSAVWPAAWIPESW